MLWTMLNSICFLVSIIGAVGAAKHTKAGLLGYAFAIAIGSVLGVTCTWAMWMAGERVIATAKPYPEAKQELYFRALYLTAVLWILIVVFSVDHVTSAAMRLTM
jgi:hypothetical protein